MACRAGRDDHVAVYRPLIAGEMRTAAAYRVLAADRGAHFTDY